jgi:hypothetical protein
MVGDNAPRFVGGQIPQFVVEACRMKATSLVLIVVSAVASQVVEASAQSVTGRATSVVNGAGSAASGLSGLAGIGGSQPAGSASTNSLVGGDASGGIPMKLGDRTIKLRGNFGVEPNESNFKAGFGLPF